MPELPGNVGAAILTATSAQRSPAEVERAARLVRSIAAGKTIHRVDTVEDLIVFAGVSHNQFVSLVSVAVCGRARLTRIVSEATELTGRTVKGAQRYGEHATYRPVFR